MKDREFRMKTSGPVYKKAWEACARAFGKENESTLSREGSIAFDTFVGGYIAGLREGKRKRKKSEGKDG